MIQYRFICLFRIIKFYIFKLDRTVHNFHHRMFFVLDIVFLFQDLNDTLCRGSRNNNHYEYHGDHHQTHQDLDGIGKQTHEFTGCHAPGYAMHISADNDRFCTDPCNCQQRHIDGTHHGRHVKCQHFLCFCKIHIDFF